MAAVLPEYKNGHFGFKESPIQEYDIDYNLAMNGKVLTVCPCSKRFEVPREDHIKEEQVKKREYKYSCPRCFRDIYVETSKVGHRTDIRVAASKYKLGPFKIGKKRLRTIVTFPPARPKKVDCALAFRSSKSAQTIVL